MKTSKKTTVTLELDQNEAQWLKAVMQNPLSCDPNPDNELKTNREMREKFFNALDWDV